MTKKKGDVMTKKKIPGKPIIKKPVIISRWEPVEITETKIDVNWIMLRRKIMSCKKIINFNPFNFLWLKYTIWFNKKFNSGEH